MTKFSMSTTGIINCNETLPEVFYIFTDRENFLTMHNLKIGKCIFSAAFSQLSLKDSGFIKAYLKGELDYLPFIPNPVMDGRMFSMFNNSVTSQYRVEYNCELYRRYNNPTFPSRLSACYAFGDYESCESVNKIYGWDIGSVNRFRLEPSLFNRVAKVNMEIVSLMRYAERCSMSDPQTLNNIWGHYWNGGGNMELELPTVDGREVFKTGVIWEYLVEGKLVLID